MSTARLEQEIGDMMKDLDKQYYRPMQKKTYLCSAECMDHGHFSQEQLQQCVQRCSVPLQQAQQVQQQEMGQFQERLSRCAQSCQDVARDQLPIDGSQPSDSFMEKLQRQVESCAGGCVDEQMKVVPRLFDRLKGSCERFSKE